jgi:hypothetical protein
MFATLHRTKVFNRYCRAHGFRPIHLWLNHRFYLQLLRAAAPDFLYKGYHKYCRPLMPVPHKKSVSSG